MVSGIRRLSYEQRLNELDMFSLQYRRQRGDLIFTRRILRNELGSSLKSFFAFNADGATRGHQWKLYKPRRLRFRMNMTLSTRVVNDWNGLPAHIVDAICEDSFKTRLDAHFRASQAR